MTKYSLNFRSTVGSWGETGSDGVVRGEAYPTTIAGLECGWVNATPSLSDYAGATDAKLSGRNNTNISNAYFRIDLPDGPGTYRIWLACGALSSTVNTGFLIRDGSGSAVQTIGSTSVTGNGTAANADVLDASGATIDYPVYLSGGGGTYVEHTFVNDHVRIERNGITIYLDNVQIESQADPLVDCVLTTEFGTGTHAGTIWAKEPAGKGIGRVSSASGTQSFSVVAGGTYFDIETRGSEKWLVTTGTRIPDSWSDTVTIRQTSGGTHDTDFVLTATAIDRPVTGLLGAVSSLTLSRREFINDAIDTDEWPGYEGQAFVSDQVVTDLSDFETKLKAITPNGTGWYRLRLQNGTYDGTPSFSGSGKDFGTGGLLVEPDTGHAPVFKGYCSFFHIRKMHFRNCTLTPRLSVGVSSDPVFETSSATTTPYPLWRFDNCNIGHFYDAGFDVADHAEWRDFARPIFAEQVIVKNCAVNGMRNFIVMSSGRMFVSDDTTYQNVRQDFHGLSLAFYLDTPRGVFADDSLYVRFKGCRAWNNPDIYTGLASPPHGDWLQVRRTDGAYPFTAGINGGSGAWTVGTQIIVSQGGGAWNVYEIATSAGAGQLDTGNPPTGTGTGITCGDCTVDYVQAWTKMSNMYVLIEDCAILQDGTTVDLAGTAQPNVQFTINSGDGVGHSYEVVAVNCICASANTRGIIFPDATVHAEFLTLVGGAEKALDNDRAIISAPTVRARRNVVGADASDLENITATVALYSERNVAVSFKNGAAVGVRPATHLAGPFNDYGGGLGWGYSDFVDDGTVTGAEFASALSKRLHHLTGAAGAKLREVHEVEVGAETFELVVAP